jgi:hypothetical protein
MIPCCAMLRDIINEAISSKKRFMLLSGENVQARFLQILLQTVAWYPDTHMEAFLLQLLVSANIGML